MKRRILITSLLFAGFAMNADAQVQANKQLQMTGANDNDRRITGVGAAADSLDAVNAATLLNGRLTFANSTASGNDYAVQLRVAPERYTTGMILSFKATWANSGTITLNVNGLGAKPVFKNVDEALEANDIVPNQIVSVIYDGTAFQIISQLRTASGFKGNLAGDVVGTQENTLISNGAVTTGKIADGAVTNDKVAPGISYNKLVDVPTALPPSGAAGGDLSGSYPAPAIAAGAVTGTKIADGAVSSLKIQDGAIISLKLADGSVLTAKIADAAITTAKIGDGAVTGDKIAAGSVTNEKITSVDYSKITNAPTALAPTGVAGGDLEGSTYPNPVVKAGAITPDKIAAGAVTNDKVAYGISYNKLVDVPTALPPTGAADGDLEGQYPAPAIKPGAVTGTKVASGAISNNHVAADAAIDYSKLNLSNSIAGSDLTNGSVSTGKIVNGAVTNEKIASVDYSKITNAPATLPPSGDAGGDLEGSTFPNPTVKPNAITNGKLADGAVSESKIAAGAVTTSKVADNTITNEKIVTVDYTKITNAPSTLPPSGDAGGDLEGSSYPAPVVKAGAITNGKIAGGAVTEDKLADGAVTGAKIAPAAVGTAAVADASITNEKIASVDYTKITGAPTSMQPSGTADGDLSGNYPAPSIRSGAVTNGKIADGAVTANKLNGAGAANGQVLTFDGTGVVWTTPSSVLSGEAKGDLTGNYPAPTIANGVVSTTKIADGAVTNGKIADGAVTGNKVAAGALSNEHVAAGAAIDYSKLNLANSIATTDLKDASVSTTKIADAAVTNAKIVSVDYSKITNAPAGLPPTGDAGGDLEGSFYPAPVVKAGAITSGKIAEGAVTDTKIAAGAVTTAKVADAAITNEKIATVDYSKITNAPAALPPSGDAGGDLEGSTYPAPVVKAGAITTGKLAGGAVSSDKLADGSVISSKIAANAVGTAAVMDASITNEKIVTVDYSKITGAPGSLPPTGDAFGDLEGSMYPAPVIKPEAITTIKIAAGAVTPDKINTAGAVSGHVLTYDGSGAVWTVPNTHPTGVAGGDLTGNYPDPAIANGAVNGAKLATGAVTNSHVAVNANIDYSKLNLAGKIVSTDLANNAVTTFKIANGAVTTSKINTAGAGNGQVLTYNGSAVVWGNVSSVPGGAASGDLDGTYPSPVVRQNVITSDKIADGAITDEDISGSAAISYSKLNLANSITGNDIVASAITNEKIADDAVTTAKVQDGAITDAKLASGISFNKIIGVPSFIKTTDATSGDLAGTYGNPTIGTNKVTTTKIADGAVVSNKLGSGAVVTDKIANGAVTAAKISGAGATNGQVLTFDGTSVVWGTPASSGTALQFHGTISTTVAYNTGNTVVFPNALTNVGNQMDATTGVFTAAADGLYQFNVSLPSEAAGARFLALRVNGEDVFTGSAATSFTAGSPYNAEFSALSLSVAYPLTTGSQVEVIVYTSSGTATPLTNGSARLLITRLN